MLEMKINFCYRKFSAPNDREHAVFCDLHAVCSTAVDPYEAVENFYTIAVKQCWLFWLCAKIQPNKFPQNYQYGYKEVRRGPIRGELSPQQGGSQSAKQ